MARLYAASQRRVNVLKKIQPGRLEPSVLDLEDDHTETGTGHGEIGVAITDADVVVDEVVFRKIVAERREYPALTVVAVSW